MQAIPLPSMPPIKRAIRRLAILTGVLVGGLALLVGCFYIHGRITPQHTILIDNGNDFAVDIEIGGDHIVLAPHSTTSIRAHDGAITATATAPHLYESVTLDLPATGWRTAGRTAVYNIGGKSELAVVTMTYGTIAGDTTPPVLAISRDDRLFLLPTNVSGAIDEAFPSQVATKQWGAMIRRVCHADFAARKLGCPNA